MRACVEPLRHQNVVNLVAGLPPGAYYVVLHGALCGSSVFVRVSLCQRLIGLKYTWVTDP